jgi:predicted phage terminase large subunit-like protein
MLPCQTKMYSDILRSDLSSFVHRSFLELNPQTPYIAGSHIDAIAAKLEACRRGEIRRLIVNLPPRNLKSILVSTAFPAWLLGQNPSLRIICASYGQDLAEKLARDTRTLMASSFYQSLFDTRMEGQQATRDFTTNLNGGRMATSVNGVLTGRGAEFIILDDPLKPDEALSDTQRGSVNDWYNNTLLSRLNDKATGCIIIVMQRLHQDDLVGHVLAQDDWEVLSLPATAIDAEAHHIDGPLGRRIWRRAPGDALHPERESLETLASIKKQIGDYNFMSQYQQSPTPPGGNMIKNEWLKFYEPGSEPGRFYYIAQSWDTANKAGELNDYSVCTTWGVTGKDLYLLDVYRKRLNFPDLKRAVVAQQKKFNSLRVIIEDKASGTQLLQDLKHEVRGLKAYVPPPGNDKAMRLFAQSAYFENGHIFLRQDAPWLIDYVEEIAGFPGAKFDDQVDSTTQFLDHFGSAPKPIIFTPEQLRWSETPYRNPRSLTGWR